MEVLYILLVSFLLAKYTTPGPILRGEEVFRG